jgi:hypothetical protein
MLSPNRRKFAQSGHPGHFVDILTVGNLVVDIGMYVVPKILRCATLELISKLRLRSLFFLKAFFSTDILLQLQVLDKETTLFVYF